VRDSADARDDRVAETRTPTIVRRRAQAIAEATVTIRSGDRITIRPIARKDKERLAEWFSHLSDDARYQRFLGAMRRLTTSQLRYFTEVDHHDHEALVALAPGETGFVGVAQYVRDKERPNHAEVAVAVVDDWQDRGVATELLRRLSARARAEGIDMFTAMCLSSNRRVLELLRELGEAHTSGLPSAGTVDVEIRLPADAEPSSPLRKALRTAAASDLPIAR
jgi:RimJ/RimL family protein N-acetyltransferase